MLRKQNDRSIDGMFVFWNPCARANLHQQKRALKLCSATLSKLQQQRQRVRWLCVRYNFLFISLLLFTKVHKTKTWNRHISSAYLRKRELYDGQFLKFLLSYFEAVLHILFGIFLTLYWPTEWIQLFARFVGWILSRFLINVVFGVVTVAAEAVFAIWSASVCLHFRPSVCSVA